MVTRAHNVNLEKFSGHLRDHGFSADDTIFLVGALDSSATEGEFKSRLLGRFNDYRFTFVMDAAYRSIEAEATQI